MLVLSRKVNETIRIGEDIEVTIMRIGPASVRVGITAPSHVSIVREELMDGCDRTGNETAFDPARRNGVRD